MFCSRLAPRVAFRAPTEGGQSLHLLRRGDRRIQRAHCITRSLEVGYTVGTASVRVRLPPEVSPPADGGLSAQFVTRAPEPRPAAGSAARCQRPGRRLDAG